MLTTTLIVLLALVGQTVGQSMGASPDRQRYAILMAYMLQGSHNVKYETVGMKMLDQNGKPVGHKGADGTTSFSCTDVQGQERKSGEEYKRSNGHFIYKCVDGNEEVVACVGSDRTNKARIEVGQNLEVNGFWHKCDKQANDHVVYTQENTCKDPSGKELHIGDEFTLANLRFACGDGKYEIIGNGCSRRGKDYKEGDTFQENHLKYLCKGGIVDITGCYANENKNLQVGEDFNENGILHRCYRLGGTIEYTQAPCSGASCSPPKIDSGPDDVPSLGRGLQSPGVASFSVVSSGTPPAGIKLDLDKVLMGRH